MELIAAGQVAIDGAAAATGAETLSAGAILAYTPTHHEEPPVETAFDLLHEDEHILAVNKPANLPCHPAGAYFQHTLWWILRHMRRLGRIHFVHRLDRETSGVVLLATSSRAAAACQAQFVRRIARKYYLVIVEGQFPDMYSAVGWIENDTDSAVRKKLRFVDDSSASASQVRRGARYCRTEFRKLTGCGKLSVLAAYPLTGRTHQIRATLCSLGFPVAGDKIYGVDDAMFLRFIQGRLSDDDQEALRLPRQCLHAAHIAIDHPASGNRLCCTAPLPDDMTRLVPASFRTPELETLFEFFPDIFP